mmetsp:Transcript_19604/g.51117  ORF Transcript_19604/g.51117 Transcript_19604/m.51117 type:complete len:310 (+) Transcript_19604:104-1033(+)
MLLGAPLRSSQSPLDHDLLHGSAHDGGGLDDSHAGCLQGLDLVLSGALASGDDGAGVAHAPSGRCSQPSNEGHDRLLGAAGSDKRCSLLLGAAANLANHDNTLSLRVHDKALQAVHKVGAVEGVPPNAHHRGLPQPFHCGLEHSLVCQGAGARHDADLARCVDVTRHDPDLALARLDDARAVGADEAGFALALHDLLHPDHVVLGDALRDAYHQVHLGLDRLEDGGRGPRGRHIDGRRSGPSGCLGFSYAGKDRAIQVGGAALLGVDSAHNLGPVVDRLLRMECAILSCKALHKHLGVFVHKNSGFWRR